MKLLILLLIIFSNIASAKTCEENYEKAPLYQAYQTCNSNNFKKTILKFGERFINLNADLKCETCFLGIDKNAAEIKKICEDPNGYVCQNKGNILDSKCNFTIQESSDMEKTPFYGPLYCKELKNDPDNFKKNIQSKIYTKENIDLLSFFFEKSKKVYMETISSSKKISDENKKVLINRIQKTRLAVSPEDLDNPENKDCFSPTPKAVNTAIFNSTSSDPKEENTVYFCIGAMANLKNMNPYSIMHVISHELSHSIDPCTLEVVFSSEPRPEAYKSFYNETVQCLRGGTGDNACKNAIVTCNSPEGIKKYCQQNYPNDQEGCEDYLKNTAPSCRAGEVDPSHDRNNSADYDKVGEPKDQIGESFSDFMAAEVVGRMLADERSSINKLDALISISSELSRLHGNCIEANTPDEHPPGFIRMNRVNMSNKTFRDALGCGNPPKTIHAGISCPSL